MQINQDDVKQENIKDRQSSSNQLIKHLEQKIQKYINMLQLHRSHQVVHQPTTNFIYLSFLSTFPYSQKIFQFYYSIFIPKIKSQIILNIKLTIHIPASSLSIYIFYYYIHQILIFSILIHTLEFYFKPFNSNISKQHIQLLKLIKININQKIKIELKLNKSSIKNKKIACYSQNINKIKIKRLRKKKKQTGQSSRIIIIISFQIKKLFLIIQNYLYIFSKSNFFHMQTIQKKIFYSLNNQISKKNAPISSNVILKQNKFCPFKLIVDYDFGQLKFNWDFTNVQYQQGLSFRFIIIIDSLSYSTQQQIFYIAQLFYKKLKLGDFLKIIYTNGLLKLDWIQKTNQKMEKQWFQNSKIGKISNNIVKSCQQALKLGKKFNDPLGICLFTKQISKWNNETILKIIKYKSQKQFCYTFHIFNQLDINNSKIDRTRFMNFQFYNYKNAQLDEKFKFYFFDKNKLRVFSTQLRLKCLNGDIFLRNSMTQSWKSQKDEISKKMYGLYNHIKYECGLIINSFKMQKIGFQLQFIIETMSHTKYKMQQVFYISVQNPVESIQQIRQIMVQEFKYNHYSEMPKALKIISSPIQKILIQQKLTYQEYLTCQKSLFQAQ